MKHDSVGALSTPAWWRVLETEWTQIGASRAGRGGGQSRHAAFQGSVAGQSVTGHPPPPSSCAKLVLLEVDDGRRLSAGRPLRLERRQKTSARLSLSLPSPPPLTMMEGSVPGALEVDLPGHDALRLLWCTPSPLRALLTVGGCHRGLIMSASPLHRILCIPPWRRCLRPTTCIR